MLRKYQPLLMHFSRLDGRPQILSFEDIASIIGADLPKSASVYRAFWANDHEGHHPHARAWLAAGYKVAYVDQKDRVVRFERTH